jgi:hypothetical protein
MMICRIGLSADIAFFFYRSGLLFLDLPFNGCPQRSSGKGEIEN